MAVFDIRERYYVFWTWKFISIDSLAIKFPKLSPYNYVGNKPITNKDLEDLQSQTKMKKKIFYDIEFSIISKKEKENLLFKYEGKLYEDLTNDKYEFNLYNLNNDQVIYELIDMQIFLFNNYKDYLFFIRKTKEIAIESTKSKIQIQDENFIHKIDLYIEFFITEFELNLNFEDVKDLKKLDFLLNERDLALKYKISLVAIIGEYIRKNLKDFNWIIFNDPYSGKNPVLYNNKIIYEPNKILEEIIYDQQTKSFYDKLHFLIN